MANYLGLSIWAGAEIAWDCYVLSMVWKVVVWSMGPMGPMGWSWIPGLKFAGFAAI
jgi:hypothetical protein